MYGLSDKSTLKRMCDVIAHRGPDESGYYVDDMVSIGMHLLTVLDNLYGSVKNMKYFNYWE